MRRLLSLTKSLNKETFLESDKEPICSTNASCVGSYSSPSPILTIIQSVLFSLLILILKKWTANLRLSPINIDSSLTALQKLGKTNKQGYFWPAVFWNEELWVSLWVGLYDIVIGNSTWRAHVKKSSTLSK